MSTVQITYFIKATELLFKAPEAEKPTILLMIDRIELEDQMIENLAAEEMVKPHGFVLDFVGIFDKLEKSARL